MTADPRSVARWRWREMEIYRRSCWTALCLVALSGATEALRLVRLAMPGVVVLGDPVRLNCSFDLESDDLYSVKWYKNKREFFRYLPSESPPGQAYELPGVHVNVSSAGSVFLGTTDLDSEGQYACEVSADAPSFQTVRSEKELKIYVLPKKGPEIHGTQPYYRVGDLVNVTCRAGASKPPAMLTWYINNEKVPPVYERTHPIFLDRDQLYHSSLGLMFRAEQHQFVFGTMKLKCTATVSGAYSLSSEEIIAAQDAKTTGSSDDKPSINGGQASYHVGDLVNVNCSYSRYGRPVHLQWHLNDRPVSSRYLVHYPVQLVESGRQVTSLGLRFTVRPSHFVLDEMRIRCTATLDSSDRAGSQWEEEFVLGHSSPGPHVSEQYVADSKGSTPLLLVVLLLQSSATAFLLPSLRWAV